MYIIVICSGVRFIKLFPYSTQLSIQSVLLIVKHLQFILKRESMKFILINNKMPKNVGISIFISRTNFNFSSSEHANIYNLWIHLQYNAEEAINNIVTL